MNRINRHFESALEKLARIMSKRYDLKVVIKGSSAMTDGKTIYLPVLEDVSEELYEDLNGFIDHEVAHCKFTEFPEINKCRNSFHRNLLNAVEDSRIEIELPKEYKGTRLNLERLNAKWQAKMEENRSKLPWPIRLILCIREAYDGKTPKVDAQIAPLFDVVKDKAEALNKLTSTSQLRIATEEIIDLVNAKRKELYKESEMPEAEDLDSAMKGMASEAPIELGDEEAEGQESTGKDLFDPATVEKDKPSSKGGESMNGSTGEEGEGTDAESGKGEEKGEAEGSASSSTLGDGNESSGNPSEGQPSAGSAWSETEEEKAMMESKNADHLFDPHIFSPENYMQSQIEEAVEAVAEENKQIQDSMYLRQEGTIKKAVSLPVSTEFDRVENFSGKGNTRNYNAMKQSVMKHITPIRQRLERVLKVKEDRKWKGERERGYLDQRSLAKLATDKSYRFPFKQFSKTDTTNVAVTLVIDCSGSMAGSRIETAKQTAVALGESLKALGIAFEVVGFNTISESKLRPSVSEVTKNKANGFNRFEEALRHFVFKEFDEQNLNGITMAQAGGANADGESITWASKRLALRPEKRKILMVLSDGQPSYAMANHGVLAGDLKRVIEMLPKAGIEPIGVGILTQYPKDFYPNNVVVENLNDLSTTVVNKIATMLATEDEKRKVA